jgi:hypothetical protein
MPSPPTAGPGTPAIVRRGWPCSRPTSPWKIPSAASRNEVGEALVTSWERHTAPGRAWRLEPRRVVECGREVAVDLVNAGVVDGRR